MELLPSQIRVEVDADTTLLIYLSSIVLFFVFHCFPMYYIELCHLSASGKRPNKTGLDFSVLRATALLRAKFLQIPMGVFPSLRFLMLPPHEWMLFSTIYSGGSIESIQSIQVSHPQNKTF
ncbi:hypothetical protein K402DRAFT_17877 [Aulographum hederae CBS 113979]|uniref:Uncharacterized protein n=1 Tax=Aulographum hederae CBS 113979 TaxID=1176131 RepID=A0A6G1H6I9_9PEZI|nr:hypothetical protein K402DRAFT_17877 [Aulographum hederae CBS 113979]